MWDKTTIRNNIHFKNMKDKKGNYIYPCKFKEYVNNENIKAIFEIKINNFYNIDKEIIGNIECFIIVPEFVYNYYSILYKKKENITENKLYKDDDVENEENSDYMAFNNYDNSEEIIEEEEEINKEEEINEEIKHSSRANRNNNKKL